MKIGKLNFGFSDAVKGVQDLKQELAAQEAKLGVLRAKRDMMEKAPPSRSDVEETLVGLFVPTLEGLFPEMLRQAHKELLTRQSKVQACLLDPESPTAGTPRFILPITFDRAIGAKVFLDRPSDKRASPAAVLAGVQIMLAFVLGDQMKAAISRALDSWSWSNSGLPREAREAELRRLGDEIEAMESDVNAARRELSEFKKAIGA